jgi:uncharacterized protein (DUF885 family)
MPHSVPLRDHSPLDTLADAYVDRVAAADPFTATELGIEGYDDQVTDYSPAACADRTDTITRAALNERLGLEIELAEHHLDVAQVNNLASVLQSRDVFDLMPTDTPEQWEVIGRRLAGMPRALSSWAESLREARKAGVVSSRRQLELGAAQARGYAAEDGFFATFSAQATGDATLRASVADAGRSAARAYLEIADVLESLIPDAPESDAAGPETYALTSQVFLGTAVDLEETYAWGVQRLREIIAEQEEVAARINAQAGNGAGTDVQAARDALDADPARTLHGTDALQAWMQETSDRALAELAGTRFDIPEPLHTLECRIATTGSGGIYYTGPSEDLSRPGRMWWDVPPETTQFHTWSETTTVYHEGVPGHHLQVGTQTLMGPQLNRWRSLNCWVSGHGEGWALYAERLMQQLGFLEDDGDRLGMLDSQRMRAGRVVLDIGLHLGLPMPTGLPGADGGAWSYESAWAFMTPNWGMAEAERRFELHRYLGWPGQAPSYALGQREWERLRDRSLANGEDLRGFHRRALELGSLPLSVLEEALA